MLNRCMLIIFSIFVCFNDTNYDLPVFLPRENRIPQGEHSIRPPGTMVVNNRAARETVAASSDSSY